MGKFTRYVGAGLLLAYALYGGCDHNVEDVLKEKYSRPIITTRKIVARMVSKKAAEVYLAVEKESQDLETRLDKGGDKK